MRHVLQALAAVGFGLGIAAVTLGLILWFAPELRPVLDDPTEDDEAVEVPDLPQSVDDEPSDVDPQPTLREERITLAGVDLAPYVVPHIRMAGDNTPIDDGTAVKVGQTWVHRSCSNARRDSQPDRVCAYCAPRLAGVPIAGGTP